MALSVDEKTNLQPRPRKAVTLPTRPDLPTRLEHEYKRAGAVHLFAAFDTRTGKVYARTALRKRQEEFIPLLAQLEKEISPSIRRIHLVLDNSSVHHGKKVQAWLAHHPRFTCFFLPVHCSWMNQVEQWFSILQRKRFGIINFADKKELAERIKGTMAKYSTDGEILTVANGLLQRLANIDGNGTHIRPVRILRDLEAIVLWKERVFLIAA